MFSADCLQRFVNLKEHTGFFGKSCLAGKYTILFFVIDISYLFTKIHLHFSLKAEWMYSQSKGRQFLVGQHDELLEFLLSVCPLHPGEDWEEDKKLNLILSKVQEHQQSLREPGSGSKFLYFIFSSFDLWIFFLTFLYDKIRDLKIIALTSTQTNF